MRLVLQPYTYRENSGVEGVRTDFNMVYTPDARLFELFIRNELPDKYYCYFVDNNLIKNILVDIHDWLSVHNVFFACGCRINDAKIEVDNGVVGVTNPYFISRFKQKEKVYIYPFHMAVCQGSRHVT